MSRLALASKMITKGVSFRYRRMTGKPSMIQALSLEITGRCIARCIMCNIWKDSNVQPDIPNGKWLELLSSPAFSQIVELDITGGEPFLRDDLNQLMAGICNMKGPALHRLRSVAITTNGLLTHRILPEISAMLDKMAAKNLDLVIACALDGIGEVHDVIRRYKRAFSKANTTIESLVKLRDSKRNLVVGIKTTIVPQNIGELEKISRYANEKGLFTIISPVVMTGNRYNNLDLRERFSFTPDNMKDIVSFLSGPGFKWDFHREFLIRYYKTGKAIKPCSAGHNYLFIRSNGDVYACPLIRLKLGNFLQLPIEKVIRSDEAINFRMNNGKFKECLSCTEPGLERYALPFEGFCYLKAMLKMGGKKFSILHGHMGLDKYL